MKKKELVHVGTFGQPQGLKGEIKINIFTSSFDSFKKLDEYLVEDGTSNFIIKSLRKVGKRYVCSLDECKDRDEALTFKGKKIFTFRYNFPKISTDEYYIVDLIGCKVIDLEKNELGKILDIKNFGAGDLMEIKKKDSKIIFIPMNEDNLHKVDLQCKTIIVNPILGLLD